MNAAGGGAPATVKRGRVSIAYFSLSGVSRIVRSTAGAMHANVTPSSAISRRMSSPTTARRTTCVPPMPVSAYTPPQPLQWNIGSVHSSTSSCATRRWAISP
jgi:hypothetical protein